MRNHESRYKRHLSVRARTALAWGLLAFLAMQIGYTFIAGPNCIDSRDPQYDVKFSKLRARLAEEHHRPLILVLGSSRSVQGISPKAMQPSSADAHSPMVFNFAMTGMGPRQQLVLLRRILAQGIRPDGILIEVLPPILCQAGGHGGEDSAIKRRHMQAEELAIHQNGPAQVARLQLLFSSDWLKQRHASRIRVLRRYAPAWVQGEPREQDHWKNLDAWGWLPFANGAKVVTADTYRRGVDRARRQYKPQLAQWEVSDVADWALRELLKTCQRERMSAALYLMPEGSPIRDLYPPAVREELENYLTRVSRDHDATLLNATLWNADEDFWDGHHLLIGGATRFSQRFGRELLDPFVANLRSSRDLSQRPVPERH